MIIATSVLVGDGFDLSAMGYIGPELLNIWHLPPARQVPASPAGIIGVMIGGPLLGGLGDKYRRKSVIIAGLGAIGLFTLATIGVRSVTDLIIVRFLTGLGLSGGIPNVTALVAEVTPRRFRGQMIVIISMGVALGIAFPGLVAATLVVRFGWHIILLLGGLLPLGVALACFHVLPESIKYLHERGDRGASVRRAARQLRPDLEIDAESRFVLARTDVGTKRLKQVFMGRFAIATPLLWLCQATNQMANFFSLTWLPTLRQSAGATPSQAGAHAALFAIGGLIARLGMIFVIDRLAVIPLVLLFIIGTPLVALMANSGLPPLVHAFVIGGAGFCVTGINLGLLALLGIIYPTPSGRWERVGSRASGGWAHWQRLS